MNEDWRLEEQSTLEDQKVWSLWLEFLPQFEG